MYDNNTTNCFQIENGKLEKFDQTKSFSRKITVPNGVTTIGQQAFQNSVNIDSVILPESLKIIEENAFQSCVNLKTVLIPSGLAEIKDKAFSGCQLLSSVTLPESISKIGKGIFSGCKKLPPVNFSNNTITYSFKNGFEIQDKTLTFFDQSVNTEQNLTIPSGITTIGEKAFYKCDKLIVVTIPHTVEAVGNAAFACCSSLCIVDFPMNILNFGRGIFAKCSQLMPIKVANRLTSYYFANGLEIHDRCLTYFDETINKSVQLAIPYGVTSIGEYAFQGCKNVKSLIFPKNFKMIEEGAFADSSLKGILVPEEIILMDKHGLNC